MAQLWGGRFTKTEESYTSKASLIDKDPIPVYKEGDRLEYHFSGKRIYRGQYESKEGTILNADVNGAGNIIRKVYDGQRHQLGGFVAGCSSGYYDDTKKRFKCTYNSIQTVSYAEDGT